MGYSCGAYITVRALELLPEGTRVDGVALLAGAFSPEHDLGRAAACVAGKMVVASGWPDWLIVGLGTLVLGAADGRHSLSVGTVGLLGRQPRNVVQCRWHPRMIALGHNGGHFAASGKRFVERLIAPAMLSAAGA